MAVILLKIGHFPMNFEYKSDNNSKNMIFHSIQHRCIFYAYVTISEGGGLHILSRENPIVLNDSASLKMVKKLYSNFVMVF